MKKTTILFLLFNLFSSVCSAQQCTIEWWGDLSDSVETAETTRTEDAAWQLWSILLPPPPPPLDCFVYSHGCYCDDPEIFWNPCGHIDCPSWPNLISATVCLNEGRWHVYDSFNGIFDGEWDVVCQDADLDGIPDDGDGSGVTSRYALVN